jgi:hypothetical protein
MTEPVSGLPAPQLGTNLRECEDQSWFKVQAVPYDVFSYPRLKATGVIKVLFPYFPGWTEENHEESQNARCPCRDSKRSPTEHESRAVQLCQAAR